MEPTHILQTGSTAPSEPMSLEDYFGHHTIDEKEALKYHCADTPEGVSRALNEQMGGVPIPPHRDAFL